jgi:hypothetical protein
MKNLERYVRNMGLKLVCEAAFVVWSPSFSKTLPFTRGNSSEESANDSVGVKTTNRVDSVIETSS